MRCCLHVHIMHAMPYKCGDLERRGASYHNSRLVTGGSASPLYPHPHPQRPSPSPPTQQSALPLPSTHPLSRECKADSLLNNHHHYHHKVSHHSTPPSINASRPSQHFRPHYARSCLVPAAAGRTSDGCWGSGRRGGDAQPDGWQ